MGAMIDVKSWTTPLTPSCRSESRQCALKCCTFMGEKKRPAPMATENQLNEDKQEASEPPPTRTLKNTTSFHESINVVTL